MIKTGRGLPNTCSRCAVPIAAGEWYAANEDAARAGQGLCARCAGKDSSPRGDESGHVYVINLGDGVDRQEASAAGKTLVERKKTKGK